jgi:N-methylhydantoinase B
MSEACSRNLPCEVEETRAPVLTERYELQQDSGGPGKFRGGLGIRRDWRCLGSGNLISVIERSFAPHWGVNGGKPGSRNYSIVTTKNVEIEKHAVAKTDEGYEILKAPSAPISEGDLISLRLGGGGGWGDPLERNVDLVRNDVLQGYVSARSAKEDYGVVIDPNTMNVDMEATAKLRTMK